MPCKLFTKKAKLRPITWVMRGAPKHEASAISGFPLMETTVSATKSATEFPIARTVSPKIAVSMYINALLRVLYETLIYGTMYTAI